jgi:ribose 5-phosphate isomerase B
MHEQDEVARVDREHLADAAHAVQLAAGEGVERRVEGLQRYESGRERRLHARAGDPLREAARSDLDLGQLGHDLKTRLRAMNISVAADERTGVAEGVVEELRRRGHEPIVHGALSDEERDDWAWASEAAARDVAEGRAEQGVVCCWTGTGASMAANKVPGIRAALCGDAETARGARKWNDANVLALSLRSTSAALMDEILDAWFEAAASTDTDDMANIRHVDEIG